MGRPDHGRDPVDRLDSSLHEPLSCETSRSTLMWCLAQLLHLLLGTDFDSIAPRLRATGIRR